LITDSPTLKQRYFREISPKFQGKFREYYGDDVIGVHT
jgi:hypothetical protein